MRRPRSSVRATTPCASTRSRRPSSRATSRICRRVAARTRPSRPSRASTRPAPRMLRARRPRASPPPFRSVSWPTRRRYSRKTRALRSTRSNSRSTRSSRTRWTPARGPRIGSPKRRTRAARRRDDWKIRTPRPRISSRPNRCSLWKRQSSRRSTRRARQASGSSPVPFL